MFPIIAELDYELCDKDLIPSILHCRWIATSLFTTLAVNMTALLMSRGGFKAKLLTFVSCCSGKGK